MRTMPLQFLTWGTTTAAVVSAAWIASSDQNALFCSVGYRSTSRALGIEVPPAQAASPAKLRGTAGAKPPLQISAGRAAAADA